MEELAEDTDFVATEHDRLISAISKLDKTQHITEPTRNEATASTSEFHLTSRSKKLDLNNVAKLLGDTAHHVQIGKKLKKIQSASTVLPKPLEKPQAQRIKRATGYEETKTKVGRWDPVVSRSRTVDCIAFPLKNLSTKLQPAEEFVSKLESKSSLEKELDAVDPPPPAEVKDEDEQLYPMTYQEMVEHRQHLAKSRAQQSYKAAKAKRQSKIKSKKYHRVLKKERLKAQLKEFEDLQEKDPEEALKKLEELEKARALERHTLRHKNTGKWAKNKLVRAKYDKDVRQELAEQLAVSRALTKHARESSDDEAESDEVIPDIALTQDPMNPWMLNRSDKSNVNDEFNFGYKKYIQGRMYKRKNDSDSDEDVNSQENETNVLKTLKEGVEKINDNINNDTGNESDRDNVEQLSSDKGTELQNIDTVVKRNNVDTCSEDGSPQPKKSKKSGHKSMSKKQKQSSKLIATSNWLVESITGQDENTDHEKMAKKPAKDHIVSAFDSLEDKIANKVEIKIKKLRKNIESLEKRSATRKVKVVKEKEEFDNLDYLKLRNQKMVKSIIDEELIETASKNFRDDTVKSVSDTLKTAQALNTQKPSVQETTDSNIDPNRFIEVKPKYLNTVIPSENDIDQLDDDEQVVPKVSIEEVFEEDDVVASFRQEKEEEANKDKPEDVDLSLPGWGAWGGKGVKPPRRKKNRFISKPIPLMPRRDENKGDIIIKEYKDSKLQVHKVVDVPFPFTSVKEYEASIRAPLGNTFIPENAHRKLIKPSVRTKAGTVIDPMDEDELLVVRNRNFNNETVLKMLGQK